MPRLFVDELLSIGLVTAGDNPDAEVLIYKSRDFDKREVSEEEREKLAGKGQAMPDGSFPIASTADLKNAIQAFGRAKNKTAVKKHIIRRAKSLGKTDLLPEGWSKMAPNAESVTTSNGVHMDLSAIEDQDLRKQVEDAFAESDTKISELEGEVEKLTPPPDPVVEASDEIKALLKERDDKIAEVEKSLAEERQTRRTAEYTAKAKPLGVLIGTADEAGPLLADIAEKAPESYEKLEPMLVMAANRLNEGGLFKEYGAGEGEGETDPIAKKDAWIEKNKASDETVEHARARYWDEHPEAVKESRE